MFPSIIQEPGDRCGLQKAGSSTTEIDRSYGRFGKLFGTIMQLLPDRFYKLISTSEVRAKVEITVSTSLAAERNVDVKSCH